MTETFATPVDAPWTGPFGLPPWDRIETADLRPAFESAVAAHAAEVAAVAADPAAPDFANTVVALERSGRALRRWAGVFFTLAGTCSDDAIREIEREVSPALARHMAGVWMNAGLAGRVEAVAEDGLDAEQRRVLELHRRRFRRAGAHLGEAERNRLAEIAGELASLGAAFSQAVLADEAGWSMALGEDDLDGLPEDLRGAMKAAAAEKGIEGWAVTLSRSIVEPFLRLSARRDLREAAWRAWSGRGEAGPAFPGGTDTWPLVTRMLRLRAERARILGHDSFAAFKLEDQMAKGPEAVEDLLTRVWTPAKAAADRDAAALQAIAAEEGANIDLAPWDWRHYAGKLRRRLHDVDDAEVKPHFALERVIEAAFDAARRLFGIEAREVEVPLHHPKARAWEITRDGRPLALFVGDHFARGPKRSGAWMSALQDQERLDGEVLPIVINVMNFSEGSPPLLTLDDARTLFHEFGHALHGMLSDVTHPSVSGTSVQRDFVELPSQLFEHWLTTPEMLRAHARHVETGAPMPDALAAKLKAAETFDAGFATVEYLASAIVDLELHRLPEDALGEGFDAKAFEAEVLARIGMPAAIGMRHRCPHFLHLFAGDGYAAGYYSYMWAEVMDADAFGAFEEAGDPFAPEPAARLAREVLSVGGSVDGEAAWLAFRGRAPDPQALLRGRGLLDDAA